ncbi:hypothetical protein I302_108125 [Kwoniella bestiolae CBS 10118]|uniref:DUF6534 domain-containing protein n=1 Tax=Kwoniella bestiolae CBS 10118 TaxID=1296100 RepID=A0AAJ8KDT3_9TREE
MSSEPLEQAAKEVMEYDRTLNLGVFIVSFGADALLCGVMIVQMINYWTWSEGDRMFNKAIVMITTTTSFALTLYIVVLMFKLFVVDFETYAPFISPTSLLLYMSILDLIPAITTQLFFTERAYKLCNRSKALIGAIGLCMLTTIVGAFGLSLSREAVRAGYSQFTCCGPVDHFVHHVKSKTGWKETDVIIGKLIKIMAETQSPPTLLIIYFFIVTFGIPKTYIDIFALLLQSKFYTYGLLASLNSRYSLRRALQNDSSSHGRTPKN